MNDIKSKIKEIEASNAQIMRDIGKLKEKYVENLREKSDLVKEKEIILNRKERNRNIKDKSTGDFQEIEIELTFDGETKIEFLHLEKIIQNQNREIDRDNIQMYINGIKYPFRNYHSFYDYKNTVRILINKNIKIISFSNMFYDCERITKITFHSACKHFHPRHMNV